MSPPTRGKVHDSEAEDDTYTALVTVGEAGDAEALRHILDEYEANAEAVTGEGLVPLCSPEPDCKLPISDDIEVLGAAD